MLRGGGSEPSYRVSETFLSVQGEGGPGLGSLAFFIRFQLCNLRCHFCDTKHTWTVTADPVDPARARGVQKWRTVPHRHLLAEIAAQPANRLIFTGGEPLVTNFSPLVDALGTRYAYEVETNGAIIPSARHGAGWVRAVEPMIQWNISPKYPFNAGQRFHEKALRWWVARQGALKVYFKFVVLHGTRDEFDAHLAFVTRFVDERGIAKSNTLIMLEGTTPESQTMDLPYRIDRIMAAGFRWSPRLHILVWRSARGH